MTEPLKAYWWRRLKNFGDAITPDILSYMSGRSVEYIEPQFSDIVAIGSILNNADETERPNGIYVWGSGAMDPLLKMQKTNIKYAAVRGPLTADVIGLSEATFGDPGLLISDIVPPSTPTDRVGVLLHHSKQPSPWLSELVEKESDRFVLIPAVDDDYLGVIRQISSCSHIFSSSLHGLIVADSYGIPNTWLDPDGNHDFPRFKFRDYAAGVVRPLGMPLLFQDLVPFLKTFKPERETISYMQNVEQTKKNLRAAFPASLRA